MNGLYNDGEEMQKMTVTVRFKVKHNPGNEEHLRMLLHNYFSAKGVPFNGSEIVL